MEPFVGIPIKNIFVKKRSGGWERGVVEIRSDSNSDSEGSGSLIGGTSFRLANFLWLQ